MKGQIEKRGTGVYRLRWYEGRKDGRRVYGSKTVRGTRKAAEKELRSILSRQDRGYAIPSPSRIPTLKAYLERWKESDSALGLRARTLADYLDMLERHVLPALGETRLDAVHSARVEIEVVAPLRKRGHYRTARLAVSALSRVFRSALKDPTLGLVGNPCAGVEIGRKPRRELRPLDADERRAFREAIRGTPLEDLWLLMMLTGLGPGEALALGWEHLDLDAGSLRVARTLDCKGGKLIDDTKRPSRRREVPLVPELLTRLRERRLAAGRPETGLVFADRKGKPLNLDNLRSRHFAEILRAARIHWGQCEACGQDDLAARLRCCPACGGAVKREGRPVRIYDLRHGFATSGLEAGLDVKDVAALLGHSSVRTTQDVYQHVSEQRKRDAAQRIAEKLG